MRHAQRARDVLREIPINDLLERVEEGRRTLRQGRRCRWATARRRPTSSRACSRRPPACPSTCASSTWRRTTSCSRNMDKILDSLTRGLDLDILSRGYGVERAACRSATRRSRRSLGMVLPSNSPGVHTLWLPIIPMQVGLVLKPGPQEPWTPYRMTEAFFAGRHSAAGDRDLPRPGRRRRGRARAAARSLIFGGTATVEQYKGNPRVQAHGPGFSARSSSATTRSISGRSTSTSWSTASSSTAAAAASTAPASGRRGTRRKIAEAIAEKIGPMQPLPPEDPEAGPGRVHRARPGGGDHAGRSTTT